MHIAIEGLDGVGKTTASKEVARRLGFEFIEKPLHYLTDSEGAENYMRITEHINDNLPADFTAMFYGLGNYFLSSELKKGKNIVTDRFLCSTYFCNCTESNRAFFDYLVGICEKPELTVILFSTTEVRRSRITSRNPNDPDLKNKVLSENEYEKMFTFCERYDMPYAVIDSSALSPKQTVERIIAEYRSRFGG